MSLNAFITNSEALRQRHTGTDDSPEQVDSQAIRQSRGSNGVTLTWWDIPAWMQDNEYILSGYRRLVVQIMLNMNDVLMFEVIIIESKIPSLGVSTPYLDVSLKKSAVSASLKFSQMSIMRVVCVYRQPCARVPTIDLVIVNIHSHLWGAILFVILLFTFYGRLTQYPSIGFYDFVNFSIFLVSAVTCLFFSASYHTMSCHSEAVRLFIFDIKKVEAEIWIDA